MNKSVIEKFKGHEVTDRRTLTECRVIARMIEADPEKKGLTQALENLRRWRKKETECELFDIWEKLIKGNNWKRIRHYLVAEGEWETQLRQAMPFPGQLSKQIVLKIYNKYKTNGVQGKAFKHLFGECV